MKAVNFAVAFSLILAMAQFMFISLASTYVEEKQKKLEYLTQNKITFESKLVNDILSMLVPKFVKNSMIKGENLKLFILIFFLENFKFNEKHDVAILFCDISNFDEIIGKEQENVIQILDKLYRCFDDLCFSFGVQKIEVIHYNIFDDMFLFFFLVIHVLNFSNIK